MKIKLLTLLILIGIGAKAQTYKPDRQHNLVVVYLIPQDIPPLPNYEERISKALLYGQEFFRQQMIQQGFGDKTFGLIKDNAMQRVQLCTVKSNKPASELSNAGAVKGEADAYLALPENVAKNTSQHMLIISPYDNKLYGGWGKYSIVYDDLGLDMNNPNKDNLALWVGGMLHELGHALQLQHNNEPFPVGGDMRLQGAPKTQAQRYPDTYRPTLMGIGNYSLEVLPNNPTILTKADCAMLDVCEIFNDVTIPRYYDEKLSAVDIIHGTYNTTTQQLEFNGKFLNNTPAFPVKHIAVFLDPNIEGEGEGANHDYNAISYEIEPIGTDSFSIALPLSGLSYQGNTTYEVKIKLIHTNGYITQGIAHIYFDSNIPGLATEFAPKNITRADRTNWTITPGNKIIGGSTKIDEDANGNIGLATNLIDNNPSTTWNSYNDAKTMYPHQVTIDTKTQQDYVGISYLHKKGLSNAIKNIELYGSNTGKEGDFVLLKTDVLGRSDGGKYISFNKKENFRYFRFVAISPQNSNDGWAYLAELNLWQGPDPINQTKPANTLVSRNGWTIRAGNKLKPDNVTTYEDENKTTPDGQSAVNESAESAIDGRDKTGWESNYDAYFPHELIIDTKSVQRFTGWSYNQLYDMYVMVKDVDILVSDDDINYTLVGSYTLNYNNGVNQINFEPRNFRYFKFVTKNAFDGLQYAAIAELNLYNDPTVKGNVPSPALKVNQTAFDFGSQNTGTNSTVQTFNLNATGLTDAVNITTTAPFYLSKDNITYSTSLVYTAAELAADKTVSVRFSPTTASAASGTISISSTGATTLNITATGVATTPPATPSHIVISEIYGGGGNSGATYKNDFIELYNPGNTAVDLTGWSVQYTSATGAGNWVATNLSGAIAPKGFYLVQEAAGAGGTVDLPTPDKIGTLNLSGTTGKVLLSNSVTLQTGANPTGANIIDKVGFGTANGFEGTAPATATTNSTSIERKASATSDATTMGTGGTEEFAGNGYDSDDNSLDFILRPPNPQNTSVTEPASTSGPNLVVTPKTLAFGNQAINTTSAAKTYVLSAGNLTNATTLTIAAPFSISKDNITFSSTLTYSVADLATNQTVYVKFSPTVAGNSTGAILHESTGATSVSVSLTGLAVDPSQTAFNFENCTTAGSAALSDGFYQYSVTGAQTWACTTTFGHDPADPTGVANTGNALQINGYSGGNILNEDWLISPALNISSFNYAILSFYTRSAFAGDKLQLKISTNYTGSGDPALATWTSLDGKFPETGTDKWTKSDNIDLSAYKATPVYVAIVYNSTTSSASRWTVDDFVVTNSNTPPAVDITTSPSSISFGFQAANTTSAASTFGFSAGNLTDDVTLTAPANFTLSKTSTGTYSSTITYAKADINNTSPTVYAKFSPATVNTSYTGNVNIATAGSAGKTVALSGNTFDAANTLEVVNWNIEWFGSPAQNPSNDAQQAANVKTVVNNLNADIYGFAEVVDTTLFRNTVLPAGYNVLFSDFGSYADNKADADYPLAQKLAFMYRTDLIKPISTLGILRDTYNPAVPATSADGSPYKNWSSGRFPYLMQAQVKINNKPDTVYFVEIHAKANTGTTADQIDAYNRRKAGNKQLKDWLDLNLAGKKVIILGDFNDVLDADKTIAPMPGTGTSYSDFTLDAANYFPVTLPLSLAGKQSTAGFNTVIDNVIITKNLNLNYIPASAEVLDAVKNLVSNYSTTTTDHYPVKTRYLFGNGAPTLDAIADQAICYAPANQTIALTGISAGPETTQNTTLSVTADNASLFDVLTIAANGTDKGTITYHLKNNISGEANITVTVLDDGGTDFGGVNKITKSFKLTGTSTATATVTGTAAVCVNDADQTITFTGANGTAPYTFTYNVNGGADQTVSTTGTSSSVTVSVPGNVEGTFAYNLLNVKDANCGQAQSGTATITVRALATASISGSATVPKLAAAPDITFTGANGTAPYTFTYNINGGANKTVTSTGNTATVSVPTSASGTFIYNLVSVADVNCSQPQTGSATVNVNDLPVATIAGNASVCNFGPSPNITFTGSGGTAPYTFTYTVNGGNNRTITTNSATATVSVPTNAEGTFTYTLVSVADAYASQTQTGTATITVRALATASISGSATVSKLAAAPDITFTGTNGTAPYTFTYNINGGANKTVTSTGNAATVSVPTSASGTFVYNLVSVADVNCSQPQTGSAMVNVNDLPVATIAGNTSVCNFGPSPDITFTGSGGTAPYTFTYTINGGSNRTVTTNSTTATVSAPTNAEGTFSYTLVSVADAYASQTQSGTATITVRALATASISGSATILKLATAPDITFTGANGTAPYTFTYNINGGANKMVTSTGNTATVSVPTSAAGIFIYNLVSVADVNCSQPQTGSATVNVNDLPVATISGNTSVCNFGPSPNITFTGSGGTAPYTFTYTINGGSNRTVTSNSTTATVSAPTNTEGTFTYTLVSVADAYASQTQTGSATITVKALATASISGSATVSKLAAAPDITFTGANGTAPYTFTYNINGGANKTVTSTGNTATVSVPTSATGTFVYNLVSVSDVNCSQPQTGSVTVTVNDLPVATISGNTSVCNFGPSPDITFTGSGGTAPYTFTYTINGGSNRTITTNSATATVSVPTNAEGTFTYTLVSVADAYASQTQTGSATVTVNALPAASISSNKGLSVSKGDAIILTATGGTQYSWSGPDIISGQSTAALTIRPKQSGTYRVTVANASGCMSNQTIAITVIDDYKLEANTVVTPNGDGYNDKFIVKNIDYYPNNTLKVFNKAGKILYTKHAYTNDWDGTINGSALSEGTYYYIIDLGNGIGKFKGYINILRN